MVRVREVHPAARHQGRLFHEHSLFSSKKNQPDSASGREENGSSERGDDDEILASLVVESPAPPAKQYKPGNRRIENPLLDWRVFIGICCAIIILLMVVSFTNRDRTQDAASRKMRSGKRVTSRVLTDLIECDMSLAEGKVAERNLGPYTYLTIGQPRKVDTPYGAGVSMSGIEDGISISGSVIRPAEGTIAFWARTDGPLQSDLLSTLPEQIVIGFQKSQQAFSARVGSGKSSTTELSPQGKPVVVVAGKWYHIILTWKKNGEARLFVDNQLVARCEQVALREVNEVRLGGHAGRNKGFQACTMARVRFFGWEVPREEFPAIMNSEND